MAKLGLLLRIEHQEAASARADQLAAQSSIGASEVIPAIDVSATDPGGPLFLVKPMGMHDLGKSA